MIGSVALINKNVGKMAPSVHAVRSVVWGGKGAQRASISIEWLEIVLNVCTVLFAVPYGMRSSSMVLSNEGGPERSEAPRATIGGS